MAKNNSVSRRPPDVVASGRVRRDQVLAVGMSDAQAASLPTLLFGVLAQGTTRIDFESIGPGPLATAMVVLSPVFTTRFDAVDLAARLHQLGYTGRYVATAPYIPDHSVIRQEVAAVAPDLSFDLVDTGRGPHRARIRLPAS